MSLARYGLEEIIGRLGRRVAEDIARRQRRMVGSKAFKPDCNSEAHHSLTKALVHLGLAWKHLGGGLIAGAAANFTDFLDDFAEGVLLAREECKPLPFSAKRAGGLASGREQKGG